MTPARVLLVEDERIVALHLRQQLARLGYAVAAVAASGEEALRQIEAQRPDVVLMDIHIEGPIDGIETTARIAPDLQIPVIYLTAYAGDTTLERARATRPYGYLLKPFSERELHATIQMAIARRTADMIACGNQQRLDQLVKARTAELEEQICHRLMAEQALRRAQRVEGVGQLASGVAHDFNNLLMVVVGSLSLLEKRIDDESHAKLVTAALAAATRGAHLTRQLLSFGHRPMERPELLDIDNLLLDCKDIICMAVGPLIEADFRLQARNAACFVDREALERVILNLALNGRQAMRGRGTLSIQTGTVQIEPAAANESLGAGNFVRITIRDTGHGMTADVAAHAFEPFFTTRAAGEGSGLGLSQAYAFAKQACGHATIESAVDKGTSITLFLPLAAASGELCETADRKSAW